MWTPEVSEGISLYYRVLRLRSTGKPAASSRRGCWSPGRSRNIKIGVTTPGEEPQSADVLAESRENAELEWGHVDTLVTTRCEQV